LKRGVCFEKESVLRGFLKKRKKEKYGCKNFAPQILRGFFFFPPLSKRGYIFSGAFF